MSSIISTLDDINFYMYVCIGLTELVLGTIGNALTVIVFSQAPLRTARTASTLIVLAILNTIYLNFAVILRVMAGIRRQNDTTFGSDVLCHFFYCVLNSSASAIVALLAWIAFDRYLCSSRDPRRRAWSTRKVLHRATLAIVIGSILINWPYAVFSKNVVVSPTTTATACSIQNLGLQRFYAYFEVPVLFTMLPLTLLFLFGLLTMKNIRTVRQTSNHLERQMSRVLLLQTMVVTCCLVPLSANSLYSTVTSTQVKVALRVRIERLIGTVALHLFYILLCSNFYIYAFGSKEIRDRLRNCLCFWKPPVNQIRPGTITLQQLGIVSNAAAGPSSK